MSNATPPIRYHLFFLWRTCLVAAMGGLLFGYDWVVIGGAKLFYEPYFGISDATPGMRGFAQTSAILGCLLGAAICGTISDWWGRKRLLILAGFLFTASAVWTALSGDFLAFNTARILGGVGIGLASNLSPMYIAELAPARIRGVFVSVNQLTIVIGILAAQVVNWLIAQPMADDATAEIVRQSWNGTYGWRWMFGAETVPAAAFFLLMFFVPESPRWLVKAGRDDQAEGALRCVGGTDYAKRILADIRTTLSQEEIARVRFADLLERRMLIVLSLGIFLAVFQQWCGINVIFNYAQEVFQGAGFSIDETMTGIMTTGIANLLFTVPALFLVDKIGRRRLMLFGAGGLAVIYALLGAGYYTQTTGAPMLALVVSAIAVYAMSLAPVTWVVISEIFPNRIRGVAMSIAVFSLWAGCAALTYTFPYLNRVLGSHGTFWLYGAICVLGFAVMALRLPETQGKSLEEIERELVD